MPILGKAPRRPWIPEKKAQEGRRHKNPFYQSPEWRHFRASEKAERIQHTQYLLSVMAEKGMTIPSPVAQLLPLCEVCELKGKFTEAKVLDHIKQINQENAYDTQGGKYGEPLSRNNTQWLCDSDHAQKSGQEAHARK